VLIPKSGIMMPRLGMRTKSKPRARTAGTSGLADALFSSTQQRVLALLFGQPDRTFYATELIQMAAAGSGAVQRELAKLQQSGLVTAQLVGRQKHYQANPASPLFQELTSIIRKTVGLAEPLRQALGPLQGDIVAAFVYGSVAKKRDTSRSDIDLLIVSDRLTYSDVYSALEPLRDRLKREVNPTVYSRKEIAKRRREGNAFLTRILDQPKLWVFGTDRDIAA
jgi:predicted nucleotidyltransferase